MQMRLLVVVVVVGVREFSILIILSFRSLRIARLFLLLLCFILRVSLKQQ